MLQQLMLQVLMLVVLRLTASLHPSLWRIPQHRLPLLQLLRLRLQLLQPLLPLMLTLLLQLLTHPLSLPLPLQSHPPQPPPTLLVYALSCWNMPRCHHQQRLQQHPQQHR